MVVCPMQTPEGPGATILLREGYHRFPLESTHHCSGLGRACVLAPHLRVLAAADVARGYLKYLEEALGVGVVVGA